MKALAALLAVLAPASALAQPAVRMTEEETTSAVSALGSALPDRAITHAFAFRMGEETVVVFSDQHRGEPYEPCPDAPVPAFEVDCEEPPVPRAHSAGVARIEAGGRVTFVAAPRPFTRFDWDLVDTDGDGDAELTLVMEHGHSGDHPDAATEFWAFGPLAGHAARRVRIALSGGRSACGQPGYHAEDLPKPLRTDDGPVLRVRYLRSTATANCRGYLPEGLPDCDCEERSMVVDYRLDSDGVAETWRFHRDRGPFEPGAGPIRPPAASSSAPP